jgi:hypothetical protein
MQWIIDLLIDKISKKDIEEDNRIPLRIEEYIPEMGDGVEEEKEEKRVIIIDL